MNPRSMIHRALHLPLLILNWHLQKMPKLAQKGLLSPQHVKNKIILTFCPWTSKHSWKIFSNKMLFKYFGPFFQLPVCNLRAVYAQWHTIPWRCGQAVNSHVMDRAWISKSATVYTYIYIYPLCKDSELCWSCGSENLVDRCQEPAEHLAPYCILNDTHL